MTEAGTNSGGSYTETVAGNDDYTQVDNGNLGTGFYTRTIDGTGTYNRSDTGLGATLPSGSGTIGYHVNQTGDPHSGTFASTETGTDRYGLLEAFKDVSNTQNGQTPGHMNFYPFGQAFVDPYGDPADGSGKHRPTPRYMPSAQAENPNPYIRNISPYTPSSPFFPPIEYPWMGNLTQREIDASRQRSNNTNLQVVRFTLIRMEWLPGFGPSAGPYEPSPGTYGMPGSLLPWGATPSGRIIP
jgi:hypothetical protein